MTELTPNMKDFLQLQELPEKAEYDAFIDHMLAKIDAAIARDQRALILTMTKKSSEEISNFMLSKGYKTFYLHSEVDTIDRWEIIKKLKTWEIDVLVGINLLREGIDLPEVGFIAILDADNAGFLRSSTALIQNIGRAARNPDSEVVLYAERFTDAMVKSLWETYRRRNIQQTHNETHDITPRKAESNVKELGIVKSDEELKKHKEFSMIRQGKVKKLKRMTKKEKAMIAEDLRQQLDDAIKDWRFEEAALIRDQLKELSKE